MLPSRSISFLLKIAFFLFLLSSTNIISLLHAQHQLIQLFKGHSCKGKPLNQIYSVSSSSCQKMGCYSVGESSYTISCPDTLPNSPQLGEYMTKFYSDPKCTGNPSRVFIYRLNTCIQASKQKFGSYMYKGCQSFVTFSDDHCQQELETKPLTNIDCFKGKNIQCLDAAMKSSSNSISRMIGIVTTWSLMVAVLMVIDSL
ncbi:hypothetical protein FDP41_004635 [Naegleria fowleri]|uniref:Uncharacterized protein n=1 Tax=Naegleria fowleri TaxID=5763 RepID=A0A6A5BTS7_NAEFO|nr:uncharacterized protein FDP41_004635 [Naegleria fowleri]KAF0976329.1 hypothetical protein FDP41_004635 [Naegleria fowleri]